MKEAGGEFGFHCLGASTSRTGILVMYILGSMVRIDVSFLCPTHTSKVMVSVTSETIRHKRKEAAWAWDDGSWMNEGGEYAAGHL